MTISTAETSPGWGYPPHRDEALARACGGAAWGVGVTGAAAFITGVGSLFAEGLTLPAAVFGAVFLFALVGSVGGVVDTARHVRIIPYYRRRVGETDTYLHGQAVARHFQPLEALARRAGVAPLSAFGFADDLAGEPVTWHPAGEGLRTVRGLRRLLREDPADVAQPERVEADLVRWEAALARAEGERIDFALLILFGSSTSALEWERRAGDPF